MMMKIAWKMDRGSIFKYREMNTASILENPI
jgi:hypothetical protein